MSEREVYLLLKAAGDLRTRGDSSAADQIVAAAQRLSARSPSADLDGLRAGVFQLRETEERPNDDGDAAKVATPGPRPSSGARTTPPRT